MNRKSLDACKRLLKTLMQSGEEYVQQQMLYICTRLYKSTITYSPSSCISMAISDVIHGHAARHGFEARLRLC